jgi:hypothetical protein
MRQTAEQPQIDDEFAGDPLNPVTVVSRGQTALNGPRP